jgi:signal transduction histidine kinase/DNA-binding LacI/PurR family transcriptional regulator
MKKRTSRPQIGLISDSCIESYNTKIWEGVMDGAEECGADIYCFMGGALKSPFSFFSKSNVIYDLISPGTLDGIVINSGSLGNFVDKQEYNEFLRRFASMECINIGGEIEGIPSITVDNEKGMRELISHLIEIHGYSKIAFIKGSEGVKDADIRFNTYCRVLENYNIPFDPDIVFPGDFMSPSGKKAIVRLMDELKIKIDAIVAANDVMAIEAIRQLELRNVDVPSGIAVVGFDDREAGRYLSKPLTTVEQPINEVGRVAILNLVAKIGKKEIPHNTVLPTKAIIRNSCGCTIATVRQKSIKRKTGRGQIVQNDAVSQGKALEELCETRFIEKLANLVKPEYNMKKIAKTIAAFLGDLTRKLIENISEHSSRMFLRELEKVILYSMENGINIQSFNEVIFTLLSGAASSLSKKEDIAFVNNLWKDGLILIRDIHMRITGHSILRENNQSLRLHWINKRLISVFSPDVLRKLIVEEFHHLGIKSAYISLYSDPHGSREIARFIAGFEYYPFETSDSTPELEEEKIRLKLNFDPAGIPIDEQFFPSSELIPTVMLPLNERKSFIVLPLFFQDEQLGFVIFEIGPKNGNIYETLAIQLSSAFMSIRLFNKVEQYTYELEKKVEERTSHLYSLNEQLKEEMKEKQQLQSQFLQAQKMEAIGRLAGGIAHDFNNIIATILGYSEYLLEDESINGEKRESVQEIISSSMRAKSLIRQLLTFSHKQVLKPEEIEINQLIGNMENMLKRLIGENISIHTALDPNVKRILADRSQIEQVLMNLVVNARDAMPRGGKILIRTKNCIITEDDSHFIHRIKAGSYIQLIVSDTGIGMSKDTLQKIFEPFFTTKERGKGTGLGLSTVFGIVKQSEGCIDVESEPGKGTSFVISLPQVRTTVKKSDQTIMRKQVAFSDFSGNESVLLVEDDEEFAKIACKMLKRYGYTVYSAKCGDDALKLLNGNPENSFDLMITDVIMPKMSGPELAEIVKGIHHRMKILYISGYTGTEISTQGIIEGSVSFLQKPFSSTELALKIREILNTR